MPKNRRYNLRPTKRFRRKMKELKEDLTVAVEAGIGEQDDLLDITYGHVHHMELADLVRSTGGNILSSCKRDMRERGFEIDDAGAMRKIENLHPEECEQIKTRREKRILGETRNLYSFAVRTGHQRDAERYRKRIEMICDELDFDPDEFLTTQQELSWQSEAVHSEGTP